MASERAVKIAHDWLGVSFGLAKARNGLAADIDAAIREACERQRRVDAAKGKSICSELEFVEEYDGQQQGMIDDVYVAILNTPLICDTDAAATKETT